MYDAVPDLGGLVVTAGSQPDGANVIARALAPYSGTLFWRCSVPDVRLDWRDRRTDRARAAYDRFIPLDGRFDENVVLQVKHGPLDFQAREPMSPLLGELQETAFAVELQVTQEYTGQQKDLCYLGPWWREILLFDTTGGAGEVVADVVDAIVGVSNVGDDPNWTGHKLAQGNLYAFGRLAWDPAADPVSHGYEYSGLGAYHFADRDGVGVDRTVATGSGFTGQYPEPLASRYESVHTCPDELLLFFHHVPYDHVLQNGRTVLQHIYGTHFQGYDEVEAMLTRWRAIADRFEPVVRENITTRFEAQLANAREWRDQVNTYLYRLSGVPDTHGRTIHR